MNVVILGLSITSSWGNGHATNYRALARALDCCGDHVTFLERDMPWYAQHRDLAEPPYGETYLYDSVSALRRRYADLLAAADLVIIGSFVPDGVEVCEWALGVAGGAVAFYDIDTPITLGKLGSGDREYLAPELVPRFDFYLSFTGGPALEILRDAFGARRPVAFYCFVDPEAYARVECPPRWELNYLGTYSASRQPAVDELLLAPASKRRASHFAVAGPMYPPELAWPANLEHIAHLPPREHPGFYSAAPFTLNVTRPEMRAIGYSPSVRLFEAAACATTIISDRWPGIETVLTPGREVLLAGSCAEVLDILNAGPQPEIGAAARERVLAQHTAAHRVAQLHELMLEEAVR
ncbi:MAG: glycosyltransferase [Solirubrobacterales bacterium]|nr:glycosyltransferase [Solirubrobacterales bacterium]